MKNHYALIFIVILFAVTACNAASPKIPPTITSNMPSIPTLEYVPTPPCHSEKTFISDDAAWIDGWSSDNKTLYFSIARGTGRAFDLSTKVSRPFEYHELTVELDQLGLFLNNLVNNGVIRKQDFLVSPSGSWAIYTIKNYLEPTPTPPPQGESGFPNYVNEIYIINKEDMKPLRVGGISGLIYKFTWFPDEKTVIISMLGRYNPTEIYAWIVDVNMGTIMPFYHGGKAGFFSISPNNSWILYGYEGALWVRNSSTGEEYTATSGSITSDEFWWLPDGNRAVYVDHSNLESDKVFLYNFQLKENTALTDEDFSTNVGTMGSSLISPDFKKLAYIEYGLRDLYIITLCFP